MKWNTFPHVPIEGLLERRDCNTERHDKKGIPAQTVEMVWTPNTENMAQSQIHAMWFTCAECHEEMRIWWHADITKPLDIYRRHSW